MSVLAKALIIVSRALMAGAFLALRTADRLNVASTSVVHLAGRISGAIA